VEYVGPLADGQDRTDKSIAPTNRMSIAGRQRAEFDPGDSDNRRGFTSAMASLGSPT
jgi:hypothetical protein